LRGHRGGLTKEQRKVFDDSVKDDDNKGREQTFAEADMEDLHDATCPTCHGTRLNATARACGAVQRGEHYRHCPRLDYRHADRCAQVGADAAGDRRHDDREGDIARDLVPEIRSRWSFWKRWAWVT
jgi:excinuclease ABC subunit A